MTTPGPETRTGATAPRPGPDASQEELVADIEATRAELGETVEALTRKLDVTTQARESLEDARRRATDRFEQAKDAATDEHGNLTPEARSVAIKVAAGVAALVVVRAVWKKVRR